MKVAGNSPTISSVVRRHLDQAYILLDRRKEKKALEQCRLAINHDPNRAEAYNLLGVVQEEMGDTEDAIVSYQKALELDPSMAEARENLKEANALPPPTVQSQRDQLMTRLKITSLSAEEHHPRWWLETLGLGVLGYLGLKIPSTFCLVDALAFLVGLALFLYSGLMAFEGAELLFKRYGPRSRRKPRRKTPQSAARRRNRNLSLLLGVITVGSEAFVVALAVFNFLHLDVVRPLSVRTVVPLRFNQAASFYASVCGQHEEATATDLAADAGGVIIVNWETGEFDRSLGWYEFDQRAADTGDVRYVACLKRQITSNYNPFVHSCAAEQQTKSISLDVVDLRTGERLKQSFPSLSDTRSVVRASECFTIYFPVYHEARTWLISVLDR